MDQRAQAMLRPSGTEPKLKLYFFAAADTSVQAKENLDAVVEDLQGKLQAFGVV